jgi:methionyl-tRNA formyltransferase
VTISPETRLPPSPRIALAGAVSSTRRTLEQLLAGGANLVGVLGLSEELAPRTSDYQRLNDLAAVAGVPYHDFANINAPEVTSLVRQWEPDLLFVVGLSQIVGADLLQVPRVGCVGFHPTWLPEGRGRAPVAWLTLESRPGAATFFLMDEGVDSGPILAQVLAQEPFFVGPRDNARDVVARMLEAIDRALGRWLPALRAGHWDPVPQDHRQATMYGRRAPDDGLIQWSKPAKQIDALVRAASAPHPGAYTYCAGNKLIVWRVEPETATPWRGVPGRVLTVEDGKGPLVQTGDGLLWLSEIEEVASGDGRPAILPLKPGIRLGYAPEDDIHRLRRRVRELERAVQRVSQMIAKGSGPT